MTDHALILAVAGLLTPYLSAVVKQPAFGSRLNWLASVLASVGLGTAAADVQQPLTPAHVASAALAVFAIGQAVYHILLRHEPWLQKLEDVTGFIGSKAAA